MTPLVPSDLVADAFDLAREIRMLDMQASPYDLRDLGYDPVPIETAEGKAAYLERQRDFAERSNALATASSPFSARLRPRSQEHFAESGPYRILILRSAPDFAGEPEPVTRPGRTTRR